MKNTVLQNSDVVSRIRPAFEYYEKDNLMPQNSILRIETPLVEGKGTYDFDIRKDTSLLGPAEKSLTRNDLFIVTHLLIATAIEEKAAPGQEPLLTYARVGSETDSVKGFATSNIEALYNGFLSIKTNSVENITDLPLVDFKYVPSEQGAGIQPKFDLSSVSRYMPERLIFAGTQNHKITVSFPVESTSKFQEFNDAKNNTSLYTPKLVFIAQGYRVIGGTLEKYNVEANPYYGSF